MNDLLRYSYTFMLFVGLYGIKRKKFPLERLIQLNLVLSLSQFLDKTINEDKLSCEEY